MPKSIPFIVRRRDIFAFRIGVPYKLRARIGCREIIRSLHTSNRQIAEPIALELAAKAKRLFLTLRQDMSNRKNINEQSADDDLSLNYEIQIDFDEFLNPKSLKVTGEASEQESVDKSIKTIFQSLKHTIPNTNQNKSNAPEAPQINISPKFSTVINQFLNSYPIANKSEMYKKHKTVLPKFLEIIGDKPVNELKQADINKFFKIIQALPPRWNYIIKKEKITIDKLASKVHLITLSPKVFKTTYLACVRVFLTDSIKNWQDQGFPTHLTTAGTNYDGSREIGENKQRPFEQKELKRLFEGDEMKKFAGDPLLAHQYWLPHIGLHTGARVNEICQLNPQSDILLDPESQIWYFLITDRTEGENSIKKSIKNEVSRRKVPIHSKLIELGFLSYLNRVKKTGSKLIFPEWVPSRGKASSKAEKWFRELLKEIGLRDVTPHNHLVGMHAFRSTIANKALNNGVNESTILGHAGEGTAVERSYRGELLLKNQKEILEQIKFDIDFIKPSV